MTVPFGACVVQALAPITPGQPAAASTSADAEKSRSGGDGVIKRTSKGVLRVVSRRDREGGKRAPLRQSIEAMFTDEGLKKDSALAKLLSDSTGGWVDLDA